MTGARIAELTGVSTATVSRVLRRLGLSRLLSSLDPEEPARRYEHPAAGDMLHVDTKELARIVKPGHRVTADRNVRSRGAGWEMAFVAVDDHSRVACAELAPDETVVSAITFLQAAVRYYAGLGISIRRITTDNAPAFVSREFAQALARGFLRSRASGIATPLRPSARSSMAYLGSEPVNQRARGSITTRSLPPLP